MEISGKRVLLTGASGGLGQTAARALAERGASLILSGRNQTELQKLLVELPGEGHSIEVVDLAVPNAGRQLVERVGTIDILIANAGLPGGGALESISEKQLDDVIEVNYAAPVEMCQAVLPQMRERGNGHIVLIASVAGRVPLPQSTMYSSTKAALRAFGNALHGELRNEGIGVSVITPGFVSEVGMFAARNEKPPPLVRTVKPATFARELIKAIEKNRGEVVVAPLPLRVIGAIGLVAPTRIARVMASGRNPRKGSERQG